MSPSHLHSAARPRNTATIGLRRMHVRHRSRSANSSGPEAVPGHGGEFVNHQAIVFAFRPFSACVVPPTPENTGRIGVVGGDQIHDTMSRRAAKARRPELISHRRWGFAGIAGSSGPHGVLKLYARFHWLVSVIGSTRHESMKAGSRPSSGFVGQSRPAAAPRLPNPGACTSGTRSWIGRIHLGPQPGLAVLPHLAAVGRLRRASWALSSDRGKPSGLASLP